MQMIYGGLLPWVMESSPYSCMMDMLGGFYSTDEHCYGLGLKWNISSLPLMLRWISLVPTSMWAFVVLKNGLPKISGVLVSALISNTTKSTGTKQLLILIGISSAIPVGYQTDWSASCKHIVVGDNELWFNLSYTTFGMMLPLAPRSQRAWSNCWAPMEHDIVGFPGSFFFLGS